MDHQEKASRLRKRIAVNMVNSWSTSPKCDYKMSLNAGPMMDFRKQFNEENGCKVSFLNIVTKAVAIALREFPYVNSAYDFENHMHIMHEDVNVGFAIALENNGLIVANVKNADKLGLLDLSAESARIIDAARNGGLTMDDVTGGSFTINNMGQFKRLEQHSMIINQPELAILAMYNITDEPVVRDGQIAIEKRMGVMLSADHRVIDGEMACQFLDRVCELVEHPKNLI